MICTTEYVCKAGVFADKIVPFVKPGGYVMIAVPGLREPPWGEVKRLFEMWAEGDDTQLFKTAAWWEDLLKSECGEKCDITVKEAFENRDASWGNDITERIRTEEYHWQTADMC